MTINAVAPYQTTALYAKSTAVKTATAGEQVFNVPEAGAATQKDSSTVYEELSGKYDIRNATFGEVTEIADALYNAGEITLGELAALTFDYDKATNNIKQHARMPVSADFSMYKTSANSSGQRDWIAEIGARASTNFKHGNLVGYQINSKIHAILQKLGSQ